MLHTRSCARLADLPRGSRALAGLAGLTLIIAAVWLAAMIGASPASANDGCVQDHHICLYDDVGLHNKIADIPLSAFKNCQYHLPRSLRDRTSSWISLAHLVQPVKAWNQHVWDPSTSGP